MSNGKSRVDSEVQGAARPPVSGGVPIRVAVVRHEVERADPPSRGAPQHEPTDGDHLDLFVGPAAAIDGDPDARVARTWRLPLEAWDAEHLSCGRFAAVAIAPHRAAYLALETPRTLPDRRGRVVPLLRGGGWAEAALDVVKLDVVKLDVAGRGVAASPPLRFVALGRRIEIQDGFAVISREAPGVGVDPKPEALR